MARTGGCMAHAPCRSVSCVFLFSGSGLDTENPSLSSCVTLVAAKSVLTRVAPTL